MARRTLASFTFALALVGQASAAWAATLGVTNGGIDTARACADPLCAVQTMEVIAAEPASGSIDIDTAAGTLGFSLDMPVLYLWAPPEVGDDLGVLDWKFESLHYSAMDLGITQVGGSWVIDAGQTGKISGIETQRPIGYTGPLPDLDIGLTGSCFLVSSSATCGFTYSHLDNVLILDPDGAAAPRYVEIKLDIIATPEPGTAVLTALGLAWIALRRR